MARGDLKEGDRVGEQGRYMIEQPLGAGAFGEVFRGRDTRLGRLVAVKHLKPAARAQRDVWQRFLQEARILAQLAHPNIIGIFDIDEDNDCIVLEFAAGGTLESILEKQRRLPVHQAVELTVAVLDALHIVHGKCIWHRDLKPANILLDASGIVKVSDFGIAHAPEGSNYKLAETLWGQPGTPIYMSPEQIQSQPIDGRSDLWAVAVILYQLVTGFFHLPIWTLQDVPAHEFFPRLKEMITQRKPKPPTAVNPALPVLLDELLLRALAVDAGARFQTAAEMRGALRRLLRTLPDPEDASTHAQQQRRPEPAPRSVPRDTPDPDATRLPEVHPPATPKEQAPAAQVAQAPAAQLEPTVPDPPPATPPRPAAEPPTLAPPTKEETELLQRAREALAQSRAERAVEILSARSDEPSAHPLIAQVHAEACVHLRTYARALLPLERACAIPGAPAECWLLRGLCLGRTGRARESVVVYREGCAAHVGDPSLHEALAVALKNLGQATEAIAVLKVLLAREPTRPSALRFLRAWGGA